MLICGRAIDLIPLIVAPLTVFVALFSFLDRHEFFQTGLACLPNHNIVSYDFFLTSAMDYDFFGCEFLYLLLQIISWLSISFIVCHGSGSWISWAYLVGTISGDSQILIPFKKKKYDADVAGNWEFINLELRLTMARLNLHCNPGGSELLGLDSFELNSKLYGLNNAGANKQC